MLRRKFIQNIALLTGGLFVGSHLPAQSFLGKGKKIKGRVLTNGRGIANVVVSDGYTVIATDKKAKYEFEPHAEALVIFVSTPAGYAFKNQDGIAKHYRLFENTDVKKEINFDLVPLGVSDNEHQFVIWADPQIKNAKDIEKMMTQSVPDVQKMLAASAPGTLWHGITVGDIVWDELQLFADYNKAVQQMGIPFFQCLGNHDMDFRKGGDETSDDTFQKTYGPTYYSFNRGQVHYVAMDNVRYLGTDRDYDGWLQQHQLDWLKKDLAFVAPDKLVVLSLHIPVHSGTKNKEELYSVLAGRNVHIMSGHTHYHVNKIDGNIYEHNHGTVCAAWWTGPVCGDGTPGGYGVYKVKGNELSWYYQSTGEEATHQMKIYVNDFDAAQKQAIVNIWNYDAAWKTEYWIDGVSKGMLQQFSGFDPLAYSLMLGPDLPKPRGFAEPKETDHLFKALVPVGSKQIKVVATDRFGKKFTSIRTLMA